MFHSFLLRMYLYIITRLFVYNLCTHHRLIVRSLLQYYFMQREQAADGH
jgi:hypothetical protein